MIGKFVLVYTDDLVGYELAVIKDILTGNRVQVETMTGTELVRGLEMIYKEIKNNGNCYLLKVGKCRLCNKQQEENQIKFNLEG